LNTNSNFQRYVVAYIQSAQSEHIYAKRIVKYFFF